jgi:23S rRNA (guanosine2251-2'-O)-methyltransferase
MNLILILDRIQDSQNLGKICRSALCFGVNLIIIPKNNSVKITSIVEQIAVGSLSIIPITQVINITETINKLKKIGFFIIGTETNTHISSYKYTFSNKTALIIGNEELGIRLLIRKTCDQIITIPMRKHNINLNAADATTILLYEINRKYHQKM